MGDPNGQARVTDQNATLAAFLEGDDPEDTAWGPPTYSRERGQCAVCGDEVLTRWRESGALVCADCKSW